MHQRLVTVCRTSERPTLVREPASSGPRYLAPVSPKNSKNTRFGSVLGVKTASSLELFADTGAKKRGPELAGSLINPAPLTSPQGKKSRGTFMK